MVTQVGCLMQPEIADCGRSFKQQGSRPLLTFVTRLC